MNFPCAGKTGKVRNRFVMCISTMNYGAKVRLEAANTEALEAVHAFLRFQISEHRSGDSTDVIRQEAKKSASLFFIVQQREDVIGQQLLASFKEVEFYHKTQPGNFGAER
jgi:hypothetical protein